jgi:mRNA interferase MazF
MAIGDIHWIEYRSTGGHEQHGIRPGILLQDDAYAFESPLVVSIPITTAASTHRRFPAVVPIAMTPVNGLRQDSFALTFQIRAVDRRGIRERIGTLEPSVVARILEALDQLLGRTATVPPSTGGTPIPGERHIDL